MPIGAFPQCTSFRVGSNLINGTGEARSRHGDRGDGVAPDASNGAMGTSTSSEIDTTKVSVMKHFGHSKVRESKPGLSGSMIRNDIVSPHFEQRGLLILFANTVRLPFPGLAARHLPRVEVREALEALCANPLFGT